MSIGWPRVRFRAGKSSQSFCLFSCQSKRSRLPRWSYGEGGRNLSIFSSSQLRAFITPTRSSNFGLFRVAWTGKVTARPVKQRMLWFEVDAFAVKCGMNLVWRRSV
jgi:hypothetical protein